MAGHSLGAGVATLVSFASQAWLDTELGAEGGGAPVVGALLVAPPNAGPPEFVEQFNARVNARRLAMQYDIVPQVLEPSGAGWEMCVRW